MQGIKREFISNNWITITIVFNLVLLFFMKVFQPTRLYGYTVSFFSKGFTEKRTQEKPAFFSPFHLAHHIFSITTLALFLFLVLDFNIEKNGVYFTVFLGIIAIYIAVKFLLDYLLISLFSITDSLRYFIFSKSRYLYAMCLLLFPFIIIATYAIKNNNLLIAVFFLLLLIRFLLILYNNKKLIISHLFYFILYFCALEIAPLFIIYKIFD